MDFPWPLVLQILGGGLVAYHALSLFGKILTGIRAFILPRLGFRKNLRSFGSWAGLFH